jgi:antitoxin component of RelBE/YafQ-DinJ toxin-antitoxin module
MSYMYDMQTKLEIRCDEKTKNRFKSLCAKYGFKNYESFLNWLLDRAESEWLSGKIF